MSRYLLILLPLTVIAAGCSRDEPAATDPTPTAVVEPAPPAEPMPAAEPAPVDAMATIDAQVQAIEDAAKGGTLTRTETALTPDSFTGISEKTWSKMHAYSDATGVVRVKLYPVEPATATEEFYFANGALIFVNVEPQGVSEAEGSDAPGDRFYFENGALARYFRADGSEIASADASFASMGSQLIGEANRLMKMGGAR
jgi:hypothetical protein